MGTGANGHHSLCTAVSYFHVVGWLSWCYSNNTGISLTKQYSLVLIFSSDTSRFVPSFLHVQWSVVFNTGIFCLRNIRWRSEEAVCNAHSTLYVRHHCNIETMEEEGTMILQCNSSYFEASVLFVISQIYHGQRVKKRNIKWLPDILLHL